MVVVSLTVGVYYSRQLPYAEEPERGKVSTVLP